MWRAGLTMMIPFIGWHMVLGYRLRLAARLMNGPDLLPSWEGRTAEFLFDGLKSTSVILAYLSPVYAVTFGVAVARGWEPTLVSLWISAVFLALPFLLPTSLPCAIGILAWHRYLGPLEAAALLIAYASIVFVIPAAFLQVSLTGRYRSAFAVWRIGTFLRRQLNHYSRVWLVGAPIVVAGHGIVPFAPWTVFWMYCSVMYLFNEVLVADGEHGRGGWIDHTRIDPRWSGEGRFGTRIVVAAGGEPVPVIDLGSFSAPLPWRNASTTSSV
jgi:hypothetical protein